MFRFKHALVAILCLLLAGSPAMAAITLHSHANSGFLNVPNATISTVGDSLEVACTAGDQGQGSGQTVSDNRGNTWTRSNRVVIGGTQIELWSALVTSANASTTITYSGNFHYIAVASFANTATSSVTDGSATGATAAFSTSIQPGSITPSQANGLLISCVGGDPAAGSLSVNGGFTITDFKFNSNVIGALGYLVQTTATAANPTWSGYASTSSMANMQAFKDNSGPSVSTKFIIGHATP